MTARRDECVVVSRSNGAWLIQYIGENAADKTIDEIIDAAASLSKARRISRSMAEAYGYGPAWRWRKAQAGWSYWLEGRWLEDDE